MRKSFKVNRICSSENYELSRKYHIDYLKKEHLKNIEIIESMEIKIVKKAYVRCFGELVPITEEEAKMLKTMTIIYK